MIRIAAREPKNLLGEDAPLEVDHLGWLYGPGVKRMPAASNWHYHGLRTDDDMPAGVIWHYTATRWGTAKTMHKRRTRRRNPKKDRAASWHVTVAHDGLLWQSVSFLDGAWHCRGKNRTHIGIELEGYGTEFPDEQLWAATRLMRALGQWAEWKDPKEYRWGHVDFDPKRRSDPGKLWTRTYLPRVLISAGVA